MKFALKILPVLFGVLSIISLVACAQNKTEVASGLQIIDHKLTVHSFTGDVLKSIAAIDGRIKNTAEVPLASVSITISFFDKDGNLLNTSKTNQQNLQSEEVRIFNVQFSGPDAWKTVRYEISASTP